MNIRVKKSVAAALSAFVSFSAVSNNAFGMKSIPFGTMIESKLELKGGTDEDSTDLGEKLGDFLEEHWVAHLLYSIGMTVVGVTAVGMLIYKSRSGKIGVVDSEKFVKEVDRLAKSSPEISSMRDREKADGKADKKDKELSRSGKNKKHGKRKKSNGKKAEQNNVELRK